MWSWLRSLYQKVPVRTMAHPELGTLRLELGLWGGSVQQSGRTLHFWLSGSENGPDPALVTSLTNILAQFGALEAAARSFLDKEETMRWRGALVPCSVDLLNPERPRRFAVEFSDEDDVGVWRVEFDGDRPIHCGYED